MIKAHNQLVHQPSSISPPQILNGVWKFSLCAVIGASLLIGLLVVTMIALPICLYKLNQRGVSARFIIGLIVYFGAITVWMLGRFLFTRVKQWLSRAESPKLSPLLSYQRVEKRVEKGDRHLAIS